MKKLKYFYTKKDTQIREPVLKNKGDNMLKRGIASFKGQKITTLLYGHIRYVFHTLWLLVTLILLLVLYLIGAFFKQRYYAIKYMPVGIDRFVWKVMPRVSYYYSTLITSLDVYHTGSLSRINIIDLSIRNMKSKKARSFITIGGMAIGIATIVFLVSIGYGLQRLVISRVAHLGELKQAEVDAQVGGKIKIDSTSLEKFRQIKNVKLATPLVSLVGKVAYHNSQTDVAAYATTKEYIENSNIQLLRGKIFQENALSKKLPAVSYIQEVAGASTKQEPIVYNAPISSVDFSLTPSAWIRVRSAPDTNASIIGYTKKTEKAQKGEEIWGKSYPDVPQGTEGTSANGEILGRWITSSVLIWEKKVCTPDEVCSATNYTPKLKSNGSQESTTGYFAEVNVSVTGQQASIPRVLGDSIDTTASDSSEFVEIASLSAGVQPENSKKIALESSVKKEAVVNQTMLKVLNIKENEAIGKQFAVTFIVTSNLHSTYGEKIEALPADFTIIGVIPNEKTPVFYFNLASINSLSITNYSQVKVVAENEGALRDIRKTIELMGYTTHSVVDTVDQINSIFQTITWVLTAIGMIALAVAALGMFNTLTVSLLERTKEVGLLKAMGMKAEEVQELFLIESFIMAFLGGTIGIIIGFIVGKIVSFLLSLVSIFKGLGIIDLTYIPFSLTLLIVVLSICVGVLTGIYPARRATKISALNALRYE